MHLTFTSTAALLGAALIGMLNHEIHAAVIHVDDSATGGANNGTSWNDAFVDLQDALKIAQSGDEIRIGQGTYKPTSDVTDREATFHIVSDLLMQGGYAGTGSPNPDEWDPEKYPTILSGDLKGDDGPNHQNYEDNSYNVLLANGTSLDTTLRGLTIRGGSASYFDGNWEDRRSSGGGIRALNEGKITLIDCMVCENRSDWGSGGAIRVSRLRLTRCQFIDNRADTLAGGGAGAIRLSGSGEISDCLFQANRSQNAGGAIGGGFAASSQIVITRTRFVGNWANEPGGALNGMNYTLIDCDFIGNSAIHGGGAVALWNSSNTTILNCRFIGNGAGCYFANGSAVQLHGTSIVLNCLFSGNDGSYSTLGVYDSSDPSPILIANCTFVGALSICPGGAVSPSVATTVANCVIWGNQYDQSWSNPNPVQSSQIHAGPGIALLNNIIQGWDGTLGGTNNSGDDPLFIDADGPDDDYGTLDDNPRLSDASPARDSGDNTLLPNDEFDLDGDGNTAERLPIDLDGFRRIVNGIVDRGAYEWQNVAGCEADVSPSQPGIAGDGQINVNDLLSILNAWGTCDQCVADITNDGQVNVNDLLSVVNSWGTCP